MRTLLLSLTAATLAALSALPLQAQPIKRATTLAKAPLINAEAKSLVEAMIANYKGLKSYSDQTAVKIEENGLPKPLTAQFPIEATLAWEQPRNVRVEGTLSKKFIALSGGMRGEHGRSPF